MANLSAFATVPAYLWDNQPFETIPIRFSVLGLPEDELYLLTGSCSEFDDERMMFFFLAGQSESLFVSDTRRSKFPLVNPPPVAPACDSAR